MRFEIRYFFKPQYILPLPNGMVVQNTPITAQTLRYLNTTPWDAGSVQMPWSPQPSKWPPSVKYWRRESNLPMVQLNIGFSHKGFLNPPLSPFKIEQDSIAYCRIFELCHNNCTQYCLTTAFYIGSIFSGHSSFPINCRFLKLGGGTEEQWNEFKKNSKNRKAEN